MEQKSEKYPENYPEEYITGTVNFFGRDFRVTPQVLIPRLETEALVRRARNLLKKRKFDQVIDIGCGSGIIGISLSDLTERLIFLDISPEALLMAEKNFRTYFPEKKAQFILSDLMEKIPLEREHGGARGDFSSEQKSSVTSGQLLSEGASEILLLANLPYIKKEDWGNMSADTKFEPELALFGGDETGFELYEKLFTQISEQKLGRTLIIEFGFDQRDIAEKIIKLYGWKYEFFADYAGIERFCEINIDKL